MKNVFKPDEIVVVLNRQCNVRNCIYCQVNKDYKNDFLINKLEILSCYLAESKIKRIRFLGGEPLLNFNKIKDLIKKVPKKNFTINTNGLLLTKDKLDFFKKKGVTIILSWDGNEKSLRINRNYTKRQIDQINKVLKSLKNYKKLQVNLAVSPQSVKFLFLNIKELYKLNIFNVNILPVFYKVWPQSSIRELKFQLSKILINLKNFNKLKLINLESYSVIPLFKNSLLIDCDGHIFCTTAAIEDFFQSDRDEFSLGTVSATKIRSIDISQYNKQLTEIIEKSFDKDSLNSTRKVNQVFENFIKQYQKIINK